MDCNSYHYLKHINTTSLYPSQCPKEFFTKEIYATIRSAQDLVFNQFEGNIYRDYIGPNFFGTDDEILNNIRTVRHFIIYDNNKVILNTSITVDFLEK